MASSLSNLANNLSEGIHRIKCKYVHDERKCETCGIRCTYYDCFVEHTNFKDDLIEYNCLYCNKNYKQKLDKKLKERFFNTYKFSNHNNNKFILLVPKGVYPYQYQDDWEKFNEKSLPKKEGFNNHFNMEDLTDADYAHAKGVCKDFEIKHFGGFKAIHYFKLMYFRTLEICVLKYANVILQNFFQLLD